jgi:hypothetical protein
MNNTTQALPFVSKCERGTGNRFYPQKLTGDYTQACEHGASNAKHYLKHIAENKQSTPILGKVVAGLMDIEALNDQLSESQISQLGHAIGFFSEIEAMLYDNIQYTEMRAL